MARAMTSKHPRFDAIILGAGGAGLMCAAVAGQRGRRVLLIDHAERAGKKILISGGGRCNFTNLHAAPDRFLSANPHFAKSALGRYRPEDFIALVDALSDRLARKDARPALLRRIGAADRPYADGGMRQGAGAAFARQGDRATWPMPTGGSRCATATRRAEAPALVIATGGPSIPKMGATGFAYDLARQFGLEMVEPRPALVPLTLSDEDRLFRELSGVSAEVVARAGKAAFREAALFTHRGLSGPAILQISSYWKQGEEIGIDFLPDQAADWAVAAKRARPRTHFHTLLGELLPGRLAEALAKKIGLWGELANLSDDKLRAAEAPARRLAVPAQWQRRLRQGRGDGGRDRDRRACPRRPWRRGPCPAFTRSARRSTSPAGLAAIISSGHGLVGGPQRRFFSPTPLAERTAPPIWTIYDIRNSTSASSRSPCRARL